MYATDIPHIKGIPEIPGAVPVFGHLLKLGEDHASSCEKWWRQYNYSIFQIKLGNTRAVVVNSFDDCKKMLLGNQNAVIDRPKLYTFHGLISSTQGFTIGSSPWDESCKKKRKAAGTALGRPALRNYYPMFDLESYCILRDMRKDSGNGTINVDVRPYIQRFALNTTLTLCYGIRMDAVYDDLLREILHVGSAISLLRSASENYQDYIPIMRYFPNNEKNARSKELRDRRDAYLDLLLNKVREMIKKGTDKPCISAAILKDQETKLSGVEVSSICLSLVSGGFETIPGTMTSCIGSLSTKEGQEWQDRAYEDIKRHYPDVRDAWTSCIKEEKIPYVNAIVKEAGRYYTVSSMSLPRKTVTDVHWDGAVIPAKTMILINAQAGNHGKSFCSRIVESIVFGSNKVQMSTTLGPTAASSILSAGSRPLTLPPKLKQPVSLISASARALAPALVNLSHHDFFTQRSCASWRRTRSSLTRTARQTLTTLTTTNSRRRWWRFRESSRLS
jgi:phenylacetate 2-hydroxylase